MPLFVKEPFEPADKVIVLSEPWSAFGDIEDNGNPLHIGEIYTIHHIQSSYLDSPYNMDVYHIPSQRFLKLAVENRAAYLEETDTMYIIPNAVVKNLPVSHIPQFLASDQVSTSDANIVKFVAIVLSTKLREHF